MKNTEILFLAEIYKSFFNIFMKITQKRVEFQANLLPEFFRFLIKRYFYSAGKKIDDTIIEIEIKSVTILFFNEIMNILLIIYYSHRSYLETLKTPL